MRENFTFSFRLRPRFASPLRRPQSQLAHATVGYYDNDPQIAINLDNGKYETTIYKVSTQDLMKAMTRAKRKLH